MEEKWPLICTHNSQGLRFLSEVAGKPSLSLNQPVKSSDKRSTLTHVFIPAFWNIFSCSTSFNSTNYKYSGSTQYGRKLSSWTSRKLRLFFRSETEEEKKGMINKLQIEENKVESLKRDKAASEKLLQEITDKKDVELSIQKEHYMNTLSAAKEAKARADSRANDEARTELESHLKVVEERETFIVGDLLRIIVDQAVGMLIFFISSHEVNSPMWIPEGVPVTDHDESTSLERHISLLHRIWKFRQCHLKECRLYIRKVHRFDETVFYL
ncbi:coiled-coil vesicle tethering protein [Artemisia annua]|uniref:Coiled-coil vesicle tethering protein n=1 Tax=Artemisia annua TaxID=35608 RepID=A0A2U1MMS6_ARTAN|nr:coiled-coil vesicle tethering protein [Artemisia annua]